MHYDESDDAGLFVSELCLVTKNLEGPNDNLGAVEMEFSAENLARLSDVSHPPAGHPCHTPGFSSRARAGQPENACSGALEVVASHQDPGSES